MVPYDDIWRRAGYADGLRPSGLGRPEINADGAKRTRA